LPIDINFFCVEIHKKRCTIPDLQSIEKGKNAMTEKINIGEVIRKKRRAMDITQDALSQKIGCTQYQIWAWESGKMTPSGQFLLRVMSELGLSLDDFKEGDRT
jgi:ribosome-binding protein aMBF1 (putative translation factor)